MTEILQVAAEPFNATARCNGSATFGTAESSIGE
jgi:hypothetical protein